MIASFLGVQNYDMIATRSDHQFVQSSLNSTNYPAFQCTSTPGISRFLIPKYNIGVAELQSIKNLSNIPDPPRM